MQQTSATARRAALLVGMLQFVFTLGWTVYVIFLPGLLEKAGIAKTWLLWLLLADQVIFAAMDVWAGFAADQVLQKLRRLGPWLLVISSISALAFLLLPWIVWLAPQWRAGILLTLIFLWVATSSALRAPPLIMLQKYTSKPHTPRLLALYLAGVAVAGACAPYLTTSLKQLNPALPFALASLTLLATVLGLLQVERLLASETQAPAATKPAGKLPWGLWGIGLLVGLAFQNHFSLNAAKQFLQFAKPSELDWLMPIFWIGFNLALIALPSLAQRFGNLRVMALGAFVAALASYGCSLAPNLALLCGAQLLAGAGWSFALIGGIGYVLEEGSTGCEGLFLGGFFSVLALAAAARIALMISKLPAQAEWGALLSISPASLWLVAGLALWGMKMRKQAG